MVPDAAALSKLGASMTGRSYFSPLGFGDLAYLAGFSTAVAVTPTGASGAASPGPMAGRSSSSSGEQAPARPDAL